MVQEFTQLSCLSIVEKDTQYFCLSHHLCVLGSDRIDVFVINDLPCTHFLGSARIPYVYKVLDWVISLENMKEFNNSYTTQWDNFNVNQVGSPEMMILAWRVWRTVLFFQLVIKLDCAEC